MHVHVDCAVGAGSALNCRQGRTRGALWRNRAGLRSARAPSSLDVGRCRAAPAVGCDPRSCTCQHRMAVAAAGLRVTGGEVYGVRAHAFWIGLNFEIPFANQPAQLHMDTLVFALT